VTSGDAVRQLLGPKWLVTLCDGDSKPQVSVAIPTMASAVEVVNGDTRVTNGQRFSAYGIPPDVASVPPTPEAAAEQVAQHAGRRVVRVPELVLRSPRYAPQFASWRIVLESPVTAVKRKGGETANTTELYFGFGETWHSLDLLLGQRSERAHSITDHQSQGEILPLTLRVGYADRFYSVTVQKR
jgi:hypothetical protein